MSYILVYLMVGVAFLFVYDRLVNWLETDNRLTQREQIIVGLFWPIALVMLIWSFIQVTRNNE